MPESRPALVVRVSAELVQIDVTVTDRQGRPVADLLPGDFEVLEDGRPQKITHLSYVTVAGRVVGTEAAPRLPEASPGRSLVFVVDDLSMSFGGVTRVRAALEAIAETLAPPDRAALVLTSGGRGASSAFTSDRHAMLEALESLHWGRGVLSTASLPERLEGELGDAARADRSQRMTGAALGALRYTLQGLLRVPGRKALVLFAEGLTFEASAPGEIPAQRLELWPLTELANRASAVVYAIDPRGVGGGATGIPDRTGHSGGMKAMLSQEPLHDLARDTGGLFLPTNDMIASVSRAVEDQRGYYLLGYEPRPASFEKGGRRARRHRIKVRVTRSGLRVRSRAGYYGVADSAVAKPPAVDALIRALETPLDPGQLGLRVTALPDADGTRHPFLRILLHVDGASVSPAERDDGGKEARLEALVFAADGGGEIVGQTATGFTIPIQAGDESRARREGFVYALTLPVRRSGDYHVRAAVRDAVGGMAGSASTWADVPDFRRGRLALSGLAVGSGDGLGEPLGLPEVTPAVRVVPRGSSLDYALRVFGARFDGPAHRPHLATTTRLLHDGQCVFASEERPLESPALGPDRVVPVGGRLHLPPSLEPGSYVVEVLVHDLAASGSRSRATRSIDFELR